VPHAQLVTPEQALTGAYESALVAMEAPLVDVVKDADAHQLLMRAGPYPFTAVLPGPLPAGLRRGAVLRVSGICSLSPGDTHLPQSLRLLLRRSSDVVVLASGPWWSPRVGLFMLVALMGVAGIALAWVATLHRRVQAQSVLIWERVKHETELQERHRLARELHDTLEQNLTGIGLCVEAASRALPATGTAAARHLGLAVEQVSAAIDEVRRSVWALRQHSLDARGLAAALEEAGEQLAACSPTPIEIRTSVDGSPRPFGVAIENDLLRIGQEALTNAVRHGKAAHIQMDLRYDAQAFRLRVSDDGCGFDTGQPVRPGHFGLVGMRERAQAMGARVHVESAVGAGTTLEITLPRASA
jgi:signal transduction histidine kinase